MTNEEGLTLETSDYTLLRWSTNGCNCIVNFVGDTNFRLLREILWIISSSNGFDVVGNSGFWEKNDEAFQSLACPH